MKIAVINFSGNVGKTTVTHHLLAPRIPGAAVIAVESVNTGHGPAQSLRGRQFGELQEFLQTVEHAVVDIGASNVEDLLALMRRYRGSHADFDCFIVPTVAAVKQQQDTMATSLSQTSCRSRIHADDPRRSDTVCQEINTRQSFKNRH
jgi:hypothetical protein